MSNENISKPWATDIAENEMWKWNASIYLKYPKYTDLQRQKVDDEWLPGELGSNGE